MYERSKTYLKDSFLLSFGIYCTTVTLSDGIMRGGDKLPGLFQSFFFSAALVNLILFIGIGLY
jgi:hypothetical protein